MAAYQTKSAPSTYIIDYSEHLHHISDAMKHLRDAPPTILHVSYDYTYQSRVGASDHRRGKGNFTKENPTPWAIPITPEEAKKRTEAARAWMQEVRKAGVEFVVPYICNQTIGGDPDKRLGMWWFYDNWEKFSDDVGPKPPVDPIEWMQREADGRLHFNYPYRFVRCDPPRRFAPCPNNPHWHGWLKQVVRLLAEVGFDGVFVDNNIIHCRCQYCQEEFRTYLRETYTPAQLRNRFGTTDAGSLRLATTGDVVLWASAQKSYRRYLKEADPAEFREKFDSDDPDEAILSEAGNGFHWGRADRFWRMTLAERHVPEEVERILRDGDLTSRGIQTARERCLWADTQKFWAWAIGEKNAELRDAAEEVRPGFLMVPNWGDMSGFRHTISRSLEGKNVRLWGSGADIVFFEEEYFPGKLAPGYTFDLMIDYKYAAACGSRACVLPYRGADRRGLNELATAEAAAWGGDGMFVQPGYTFPEIRRRYRAFFERHADWFTRRSSYADVGLVLSFDELHMGNTHHLHEAYPLARYLADQHILFDFLCEGQIILRELTRFQAVIVPHVQFLPTRARRAILEYLEAGGGVLITGNAGAYDEHARPVRRRDLLTRMNSLIWPNKPQAWTEYHGDGYLIWLNDVRTWLPKRLYQVHELVDLHEEEIRTLLPRLREAEVNEPADDSRLREILDHLARRPLAVLSPETPRTLRVSVWAKRRGDPSLLVQLINYDIPGPATPEAGDAVPVENVEVRLPIPDGMSVSQVIAASPWNSDGEEVAFRRRGGAVRFVVPKVDVYHAVHVA